MAGTVRSRTWCWTLNNYTDAQRTHLSVSVAPAASFLIYQPERGAEGTPHLQGFICFANPRAFAGVRRLFGDLNPHLERMRGTCQQAIDYCRKDDSRDVGAGFGVQVFGVEPDGPGQGSRTDLAAIGERLRQGETVKSVAEDHPADFIRYSRGLIAYAQLFAPQRTVKTRVSWFYGNTGLGKSHAARERSANAYWKSSSHTWWDGYDGKSDVVIDDYRCSFCKFSYLLNLFDEYPMQVEVKGATLAFACVNLWITAPQHPRVMWASRTDEALAQLLRRIDVIECFGPEPDGPAPLVEGFNPV
jgi:hypothetical protein